jgi:hypothetical protein
MDSYSYNAYARYYDKKFPSDFQKSCNESAALREDYQKNMFKTEKSVSVTEKNVTDTKVNDKVETNTNDVLDTYVILNPSPKVD